MLMKFFISRLQWTLSYLDQRASFKTYRYPLVSIKCFVFQCSQWERCQSHFLGWQMPPFPFSFFLLVCSKQRYRNKQCRSTCCHGLWSVVAANSTSPGSVSRSNLCTPLCKEEWQNGTVVKAVPSPCHVPTPALLLTSHVTLLGYFTSLCCILFIYKMSITIIAMS